MRKTSQGVGEGLGGRDAQLQIKSKEVNLTVASEDSSEYGDRVVGIDQRFDEDVDEDDDDDADQEVYGAIESGSDGYEIADELFSPRAAKDEPLEQNFVPEEGKKYFCVTIGYPAMRTALRERGWLEVKSQSRVQNIAGYICSPTKKNGKATAAAESLP